MANVLLIDDDPSLTDALTMELEDAGHDVLVASDGALGWARIRRTTDLHIVVTDVNMPGIDGFSLCRRDVKMRRSLHMQVRRFSRG